MAPNPNPKSNSHGKGVHLDPWSALESQWCTRSHESALRHPSQCTDPPVQ